MPSVYPTGTTIFKPDKCWSGYTILGGNAAGVLIDMNGNVVKEWPNTGDCGKILPGGYILAPSGKGPNSKMIQMDFDGNIVWQFNRFEQAGAAGPAPGGSKAAGPRPGGPPAAGPRPGGPPGPPSGGGPPGKKWSASQHHDFQREGSPAGYYSPELEPMVDKGKTLVLAATSSRNPKINSNPLKDDVVYEATWDGKVIWKWVYSEHVDEMGFSEAEFEAMRRSRAGPAGVDWFHANCASWVGPNKWYDAGDERFHPDNIISDSKTANILLIIDRKTGKIVWQVGPRYDTSPQLKKLGWIIGPHHTHMIPKGLPGAGNIMVYDNGGDGGYGEPNPISRFIVTRDYSRVLEFNPVTLEIVWEYSAKTLGIPSQNWCQEYSKYISGAQRLPNGNTLITEGAFGRLIEVTPKLEIVWEYISSHYKVPAGGPPGAPKPTVPSLKVYRSYRVPYEWVPQLTKPKEVVVIPPHNKDFKVQGSGGDYRGYVAK